MSKIDRAVEFLLACFLGLVVASLAIIVAGILSAIVGYPIFTFEDPPSTRPDCHQTVIVEPNPPEWIP